MESRAKLEPGSGKHSVYTHFPKDPNCDICLKTKITRASCRRRAGTVVPRAENFRDLITADHKHFGEDSESRNNHRYAVVLQDLATQWLQSHPCKPNTSKDTQKNFMKFLEPTRKPQVIYTDNSFELASLVRNYPGIIVRQRHTDLKQIGLPKQQHAEWKKGHLRCYGSPVWVTKGARIPRNLTAICETFKISCLMGRHHMKGGSECLFTAHLSRLEQWSNITLFVRRTCRDYISLAPKSCQVFFSIMNCMRGESGKETLWSQTPEGSMQRKC